MQAPLEELAFPGMLRLLWVRSGLKVIVRRVFPGARSKAGNCQRAATSYAKAIDAAMGSEGHRSQSPTAAGHQVWQREDTPRRVEAIVDRSS